MIERPSPRWEDVTPRWQGPFYQEQALRYHRSVASGWVGAPLISCVDVVDWDGDGGKDLLVSSWDACYEGGVRLYEQIGRESDGTPQLGAGRRVEGITGYVSVIPDGDTFHLLSTSRLRRELYLHENIGVRSSPAFGPPATLILEADWICRDELLHLARFVDLDGDGRLELLVGTDYWQDYWPDGVEWNEPGYTPYTSEGQWRGGPLRGHLYVFVNEGTANAPRLSRGVPILADGEPLERYGQLAPAAGDFRGIGHVDLICGDFLDRLYFAPCHDNGTYGRQHPLKDKAGNEIVLDHCIHFPVAAHWCNDGRMDLLVGAEDGYVSFLRNTGPQTSIASSSPAETPPTFEKPVRVRTRHPDIHAGVLPVPAWWPAEENNDGRLPALIVGNSAGEVLYYPWHEDDQGPSLGQECALRAGGSRIRILADQPGSIQGPSEVKFGYSCPTIADWDGDGKHGILMSDVLGRHLFFRRSGTTSPPEFEPPLELVFDNRPLRTVWRVRPAVVDWEGSGHLSYLCLDEQGLLASYRRNSDVLLDHKRVLRFESGDPVQFTEDFGGGLGRMKLCICDWTGDGRKDILFGTHCRASVPPGKHGAPRHTTGQAGIFLLQNVGTNADPCFALPSPLRTKGVPLQFGMHACSPEVIRRPRRDCLDLLVGVEDGSILLFQRKDLEW